MDARSAVRFALALAAATFLGCSLGPKQDDPDRLGDSGFGVPDVFEAPADAAAMDDTSDGVTPGVDAGKLGDADASDGSDDADASDASDDADASSASDGADAGDDAVGD